MVTSKIIIANWKMNLSIKKGLEFIKKIKKTNNKVVIAAPYTFLCELTKLADKKKIKMAAQDVASFEEGAYTGEVSAKMLKRIGCVYCLVGHSERRVYFKETDKIINQKIIKLLAENITPILCIGETAIERKKGLTEKVIKKQLEISLKGIKDPGKILIAYEPIWAISTFQKSKKVVSASNDDIVMMHSYIRKVLKIKYKNKSNSIKILYGGTVNPKNSKDILSLNDVSGALVGGASLKVSSFNDIIDSI